MISEEIQKNIIKEIKEMVNLPMSGIVAGQAVASLAFKYLGLNLPIIINDIDIFNVSSIGMTYNYLKTKGDINILNNGTPSDINNFSLTEGYGYRVIKSEKFDNKINLIQVEINKVYLSCSYNYDKEYIVPDKDQTYQLILNSFDINCCSIGFDIETEKFYWSHGFEYFIKTKQLKIQTGHTPYPTIIRLLKKKKELNLECDLYHEIKMLLIINKKSEVNKWGMLGDKDIQSKYIVGKIFLERLKKYKEVQELLCLTDYHVETKNNKYYTTCLSEKAISTYGINEYIESLPNKFKNILFENANSRHFIAFYNANELNFFEKEYNDFIINEQFTNLDIEKIGTKKIDKEEKIRILKKFLINEDPLRSFKQNDFNDLLKLWLSMPLMINPLYYNTNKIFLDELNKDAKKINKIKELMGNDFDKLSKLMIANIITIKSVLEKEISENGINQIKEEIKELEKNKSIKNLLIEDLKDDGFRLVVFKNIIKNYKESDKINVYSVNYKENNMLFIDDSLVNLTIEELEAKNNCFDISSIAYNNHSYINWLKMKSTKNKTKPNKEETIKNQYFKNFKNLITSFVSIEELNFSMFLEFKGLMLSKNKINHIKNRLKEIQYLILKNEKEKKEYIDYLIFK